MSARLIVIFALAALVAASAVATVWIVVRQTQAPVAAGGEALSHRASDAERREYREKFFGGDTARDIRGGQEMKPRW